VTTSYGYDAASKLTSEFRTGYNASYLYDAYGMVTGSAGTWKGPFGYSGGAGYQEDETGLQLLGHRYYDPSTGRFLTRDPIKDGRNWYVYCDSNPLSRIDVDGLLHIDITLGANGLGQGQLIADAGDIIGYYELYGVKVPIIASGGEVLHEFDVSNRTKNPDGNPFEPDSNGPYPAGSYDIDRWQTNYYANGSFLGSTIFTSGPNFPRRGTWLHTGKGEDYRTGTLGCIRFKQSDMDIIFKYLNMNKKGSHRVNVKQNGKRSSKNQAPKIPVRIRDPHTRM
jgi:RHS repeat-associated protein